MPVVAEFEADLRLSLDTSQGFSQVVHVFLRLEPAQEDFVFLHQ